MNSVNVPAASRLLRLLLPVVSQCLHEKKARVRGAADRALALQSRPGSPVPPNLVKRLLSLADAYDSVLDLLLRNDLSSRLCDALMQVRIREKAASAEQRRFGAALNKAAKIHPQEHLS